MSIADSITPQSRPWLWLLAIYAAMLALNGFSEEDAWQFMTIAVDPTMVLEGPRYQFLYSSPINYFISYAMGRPTVFGFMLIHVLEIMAMLATILHCVQKKLPAKDEQIRFLALLSLTPLWLITLKWIGKPDPILISMLFLCWAYPGRWRWLFAAVMVIAHREMGVFMCLFLFVSEETPDYSLMVPILIGEAFHYLYQTRVLDFTPVSRFEDFSKNIWLHPLQFLQAPGIYVMTSLSWYWLVALWQRPHFRQCLTLAVAFGLAVASEDFTRDFILMALAPLLFHLEQVVKTPAAFNLVRFLPLGLLQMEIASNGLLYKPGNVIIDNLVAYIGHALAR